MSEPRWKRRSERGLTQAQAAMEMGANEFTSWERGRTKPSVRFFPAILAFLGYDPFPAPKTLPERIAAKQRQLGLTIAEAADLVEVEEGTFAKWESGEWIPRFSEHKIERFLSCAQGDEGDSELPF